MATPHTVAIDGGPTVWSMCAVDALGISDMLGGAVTITSTDPASDREITVRVHDGQTEWQPDTAVVLVGSDTAVATSDDCRPADLSVVAAADRCCSVMNFFTDAATAREWLSVHPQVFGVVLTKEQAFRLGVDIFGRLLEADLYPGP